MALDVQAQRSRRTILVAALGGLGAWAASALRGVTPADATDGLAIIQGADNGGSLSTVVRISTATAALQGVSDATGSVYGYGLRGRNSSDYGAGVLGVAAGSGISPGVLGLSNGSSGSYGVFGGQHDGSYIGVHGESGTWIGVRGYSSSSYGVVGGSGSGVGVQGVTDATNKAAIVGMATGYPANTGILGFSGAANTLPTTPAKTGVFGYAAQDATAVGVKGQSTSGVGVLAVSSTGNALQVAGKTVFSRSGRASVPINASYVDVTVPGGLTSSANVLALLQANRSGVWVRAVRTNYPSSGKARIYLNKVASTSVTTPVAWFVLN